MPQHLAYLKKLKCIILALAIAIFSFWALMSTAQTRPILPSARSAPPVTAGSVFINGQPAGTLADLRLLAAGIRQLLQDREQKAVFLVVDPNLTTSKFNDLGWAIQKVGGEVYFRKTGATEPAAPTRPDPLTIVVSIDGADKNVVAASLASSFFDNLRNSCRVKFHDYIAQGISLKSNRAKGSFEIGAGGIYLVNEGPETNFANASVTALTFKQRPIEKDEMESGFKAILKQHAGVLKATEFELRNEDPAFAESVLKSVRSEVNEITIVAPPNAPASRLAAIFDAAKGLDVSFAIIVKKAGTLIILCITFPQGICPLDQVRQHPAGHIRQAH